MDWCLSMRRCRRGIMGNTFLMQPFDITLYATEEGVQNLYSRFSTWLRSLTSPARFICWQQPATLDDKIEAVRRAAQSTDHPQRSALLTEYRRHYESLQDNAHYQRTVCGMALWQDNSNPRAVAASLASA